MLAGKKNNFCWRIKKLFTVKCKIIIAILNAKKRTAKTARLKEAEHLRKVVQANKSIWRMPWYWEPKKDVTSCDKLRGAAYKL